MKTKPKERGKTKERGATRFLDAEGDGRWEMDFVFDGGEGRRSMELRCKDLFSSPIVPRASIPQRAACYVSSRSMVDHHAGALVGNAHECEGERECERRYITDGSMYNEANTSLC